MMDKTKMEVELLPKQKQFIDSDRPEVLYSGAAGAGKTRALCYKCLKHAVYSGNLVGLFRKTRVSLKNTTLRTLLKPDGKLDPVLPEGTYEHNKSESLINLYGGGEIFYGGFDQELKLGSLSLGSAFVDEGLEIDEDEYEMLLTRLRNTADPNHQICTATNPGPPTHYLYERFFEQDSDDREVIKTNSRENIFLDESYFNHLESLTGTTYQRLVLGEWVGQKGLIFGDLDIIDYTPPSNTTPQYILGIDAGYHSPHALLIMIPDSDNPPHVIDEVRGNQITNSRFADNIVKMTENYEIDAAWVDPSAPDLIDELLDRDIPAQAAENDVLQGISKTKEISPTVSKDCTNLIKELQAYCWNQPDVPKKENDHGCDALRYGIYSNYLYGYRVAQVETT